MTQQTRSIKLEPENWQTIKALADAQGVTVNALISHVLKVYVWENGERWKPSAQWGGKRVKRTD